MGDCNASLYINLFFGRAPLASLGGRAASQTVAKRRENTNLPICHAPHGHSRMSIEEVLQQSPSGFAKLRLASPGEARPPLWGALRIPHAGARPPEAGAPGWRQRRRRWRHLNPLQGVQASDWYYTGGFSGRPSGTSLLWRGISRL